MSKVKIIYGSGGGNTELVCEKVAEVLRGEKHEVDLLRAKLTKPSDVGDFDLLILASPTYGHGQLETYFEKFFKGFQDANLKDRKCCSIGLGDLKYDADYLLESVKVIEKFFEDKGANVVCKPLKIVRTPIPFLENLVTSWAKDLSKLI